MNASIEIQNGVKTLSNSPLDAKYFNNNGVPYTNVAEVMAQLPLALRNQGLVVNIGGVEYWWNTSDVSIEPVIKTSAAIEYSTNIEADKLSTTKVSAIKTLYDWAVGKFQSVLVSGTNIKTINSTSILGSGDIVIEAGSVDYDDLTDKPQINSVELVGNKTAIELGLALDNHTHDYEPANNSITNAKLSQVPTATIKGRASLGTGNVEDLTPAQVIAMLNITPAKELVISKSTFNSIAEPGIYKNNAIAKNITGHRLTTNATDFSITVAGVTYTNTATYPIALPANAELIINDVTIQTGYNIGNVILIIE